jgi:hypothetical protein
MSGGASLKHPHMVVAHLVETVLQMELPQVLAHNGHI